LFHPPATLKAFLSGNTDTQWAYISSVCHTSTVICSLFPPSPSQDLGVPSPYITRNILLSTFLYPCQRITLSIHSLPIIFIPNRDYRRNTKLKHRLFTECYQTNSSYSSITTLLDSGSTPFSEQVISPTGCLLLNTNLFELWNACCYPPTSTFVHLASHPENRITAKELQDLHVIIKWSINKYLTLFSIFFCPNSSSHTYRVVSSLSCELKDGLQLKIGLQDSPHTRFHPRSSHRPLLLSEQVIPIPCHVQGCHWVVVLFILYPQVAIL